MPVIQVVQFGNQKQVTAPEGATLADVVALAGLNDSSTIRYHGETVEPEQRNAIVVKDGETVVAAPPQVSHGGGEAPEPPKPSETSGE